MPDAESGPLLQARADGAVQASVLG